MCSYLLENETDIDPDSCLLALTIYGYYYKFLKSSFYNWAAYANGFVSLKVYFNYITENSL